MLRKSLILVCLAALATACAEEPRVRRTGPDVRLPSEVELISARVPRNATLETLLRAHDLSGDLVSAAVTAARGVFNPRDLRADRPYKLVRSIDGLLREFEYEIDGDRLLRIVTHAHRPTEVEAKVLPIEKQTVVSAIAASIDAARPSLISALSAAGESVQLALALADVFSGSIDFESDLQPGDGFDVVFEKSTRQDGEFGGYGQILGARFVADGKEHQAYLWKDPATGKAAYYDENGRSLKRFFLKTPMKFEVRVTSGFSTRRLHPVHRTYRPHLGVDYGAPHGAPVVAVASGTVVSAGWAGAGGNQVRIRHTSGYESYYLHLSSFGKGIRAGARVTQGDVIGRVGSTGTATGPHLDYRLRKNGVFVNPRAEHARLPPGDPIAASQLAAFRELRDDVRGRMDTMLAERARNRPDAIKAGSR